MDKKQINAEIIADSVAPDNTRLTTFVLTLPRIVLAEFNTHRAISRNSASSRAVPYKKMLEMVKADPFIPIKFQKDHSGMQGTEYFEGGNHDMCVQDWLYARDSAVFAAEHFNLPITKQLKNRLLEPFMWHTVIATATDWQNFFALRAHEAAEIHIQDLAYKMLDQYNKHEPEPLDVGQWHIPFGDNIDASRLVPTALDQKTTVDLLKTRIATARCARVSYFNYEGKDDYEADLALYDTLKSMGHMSPFEHCAVVRRNGHVTGTSGNFSGQWTQLRKKGKLFDNENRTDDRVVCWK